MLNLLLALGLSALPAAVLLLLFYRMDKARPEPVGLLGKSVLYGFLAVIPAVALELLASVLTRRMAGLSRLLFESFLVAGFVEESVKLVFIKRYIMGRPEFDERADGIVYAICVSLGFAFVENFLYGHRDFSVLFLRAFTAVPGHAIFSGVMGYYLGRAKLEEGGERLWRRGLAWAVTLHGGYDFLIMAGTPLAYLVFPFILAGWLLLRSLFKRARAADAREEAGRSTQSRLPPIL